jgi:hypothetical protein
VTSLPPPPTWLAPLQEAFGALLEAPLDSTGGRLRSHADVPALAAALADPATARARLTLYHEQYWMRLYGALHAELPRFAQVVGYWRFNGLATLHLREAPPTRVDLARCGDGLAARLLAEIDRVAATASPPGTPDTRPIGLLVTGAGPWEAALRSVSAPVDLARQALRMDEAARRALASPFAGVWRPSGADAASLPARRLRFAPSFRLLREDWALAERAVPSDPPAPFARHAEPWFWVSFRAERTTALARVEPGFARLLALAAERPFGEAIDLFAHGCDTTRTESLGAALPGWIERALASGWWIGAR